MPFADLETVIDKTLTVNFAESSGEADIRDHKLSILYIDYTKGDEGHALLKLEFAAREAITEFFEQSVLIAGIAEMTIKPYLIKLEASAKVRLPIDSTMREDLLKVSAKIDATSGSPGSLIIKAHNSVYTPPSGIYKD